MIQFLFKDRFNFSDVAYITIASQMLSAGHVLYGICTLFIGLIISTYMWVKYCR